VRAAGLPSRRACRTPCIEGLAVESQNAFPQARHDLLGAVDLATPRGLDHHRLATWSAVANRAAVSLSRRLAGLGRLPDAEAFPRAREAAREERFDALVVGAGPAGLAAGEALAEAGRRALLAEQDGSPGGRLRARLGRGGDLALDWARAVVERVRAAGGDVALGAPVLGIWHDGGSPLAVLGPERGPLRLVRAAWIVLCCGGDPQPLPIPGGDRPGVVAARGVATLLSEHGTVPGARAAVVGEGEEAAAVAERLASAGMRVEVVPSLDGGRLAGRARVRAVVLPGRRIACDTVAVATAPAPATDLGRALGAPVSFVPALGTFALDAAPDGSTGVPGLLAAGEVTGPADAARAAEAGRRAGEAARG
jgi:sarcosine oxidase subunit alpha